MKVNDFKVKKSQRRAITVHPEPETTEALVELADADDRPLKVYIERILDNYIKEIKGEKQTTNY